MWVLIVVSLWSPVHGIDVMDLGTFRTLEECEVGMVRAEERGIADNTSEGLMCLELEYETNGWWTEPQ